MKVTISSTGSLPVIVVEGDITDTPEQVVEAYLKALKALAARGDKGTVKQG